MTALKQVLQVLYELDELFRFHQLGFVALWPLLGLASTGDWSAASALAIIAVAFFFNSFGVILNDVVDLPVDLSAPLRRKSLLVRQFITPRQALAIAIVQLPLMIGAHIVGGLSIGALSLLLAVTLSLAAYDLWSKTCPLPPLIDVALASSGFLFVLYGARVTAQVLAPIVWLVAASAAVFLLYVNAFSNGLRDLDNDLACGRRTTPIWLGCRGIVDGRVHISARMSVYSALLQTTMIALAFAAVGQLTRRVAVSTVPALVVLASAVNIALFVLQHYVPRERWGILMRLHLLLLPTPLMLAFVTQLSTSASAIVFSLYFGVVLVLAPLLTGRRHDFEPATAGEELACMAWPAAVEIEVHGRVRR